MNKEISLGKICSMADSCKQAYVDIKVNESARNKASEDGIHWAAAIGQAEAVEMFLRSDGFDVNAKNKMGRTALHVAAFWGQLAVVKLLLLSQADKDARDTKSGKTALHLAAERGHVDVVIMLCQAHADKELFCPAFLNPLILAVENNQVGVVKALIGENVNVNAMRPYFGTTALHHAVGVENVEMVDTLLEAGADIMARNYHGVSPLDLAHLAGNDDMAKLIEQQKYLNDLANGEFNQPHGLQFSCRRGFEKLLKKLLATGRYSVDDVDNDGNTALHIAAGHGFVEISKTFMANSSSESVDAFDAAGSTALMIASSFGNCEIVRILLEKGDNVNLHGKFGDSALHCAAKNCQLETARCLLEAGADVNGEDADGETPLIVAVGHGHSFVVRLLLDQEDININAVDKSWRTALEIASTRSYLNIVRMLIAAGATINYSDSSGDSAMFIACRNGNAQLVSLLISAGVNLETRNGYGSTALQVVAESGNLEIAKLLLEAGCSVNAADDDGNTALHLAAMSAGPNSKRMKRLLLNFDADSKLKNADGRRPAQLERNGWGIFRNCRFLPFDI